MTHQERYKPYYAERDARRYDARRAAGRCGLCGKSPRAHRATCRRCATRNATWQRAHRVIKNYTWVPLAR